MFLDSYQPSFEDMFPGLVLLGQTRPAEVRRAKRDVLGARDFARNHLRPLALPTDLKLQKDPKTLAREMVELALRHRLLSQHVPQFMGGGSSGSMLGMCPCVEEIAAIDPGFQGLMGGHQLGLVALGFSFNFKMFDWVADRITSAEKQGRPFLIDCAITEPTAGSDVEEEDLFPHADLSCRASRVPGGAVLNGRKCFISTSHLADYHLVIIPYDPKAPMDTMGMFLIPGDAPGFSLGVLEDKMGQKAGPAGELVFDDCFVPDVFIINRPEDLPPGHGVHVLHSVLGLTRIAVGAWSTGIARGAYEIALAWANTHEIHGRKAIHQQWVQKSLTDMLAAVNQARAAYMEAANVMHSGFLPLQSPKILDTGLFRRLYRTNAMKRIRYNPRLRRYLFQKFMARPFSDRQRLQYYASLAKVAGSDAGMKNCHKAIDLMGADGLRHDAGVEKLFRDAKLCQIFEGTNQLNRLHMFKHMIARDVPGVEPF